MERAYLAREQAIRRLPTQPADTTQIVAALHTLYDDIGRYAAYLGFDAVRVRDREYYIVLNRTALRVQREDLR